MTDGHRAPCDWCKRDTRSLADPPAMIKVDATAPWTEPQYRWMVCLDCFAEWIKFIAQRDAEAAA